MCVFFLRYVKCYLLPDQTKLGKRKTTVKKKTLNPTYNEILRVRDTRFNLERFGTLCPYLRSSRLFTLPQFKVTMEVLKTQALDVSVWHNDTFGRNAFLGKVDLDLSEWDFSNTRINDYALKARVKASNRLSP